MRESFDNMAQRVAYGHVGAMPKFVPVASDAADGDSQRQMYDLMLNINRAVCETPEVFGLPLHPDDAYESFALRNRKPELVRDLKAIKAKLDKWYLLLIDIGRKGELTPEGMRVSKAALKLPKGADERLAAIGIRVEVSEGYYALTSASYPRLFPGWKLLAQTSESARWPGQIEYPQSRSYPVVAFSHALFDLSYPCSLDVFRQLLDDPEPLRMIREALEALDYRYMDIRESILSADWYKLYGKKPSPLKSSWSGKEYGGLTVEYNYLQRPPFEYSLRVPMYAQLLEAFDRMDDELKDFVTGTGKKCDGCGYCTQTDKTGERPRQLTKVEYAQKAYAMCNLYPGFSFRWNALDLKRARMIIALLRFCDSLFAEDRL